jgi:hypothetical protein
MSRKARIAESAKQDWACVRTWAATKGYSPYKPKDHLDNTLVILEHSLPEECHPMRGLMAAAQELMFPATKRAIDFTTVLQLDLTALLQLDLTALRAEKASEEGITMEELINDECSMQDFGKRIGKPLARLLSRLHLRGATLVARGAGCQLALKLLSPRASRSLNSTHVQRIVMIHPFLTPTFINNQLTVGRAVRQDKVALDVVYPLDAKEMTKREPILRHFYPKGAAVTWEARDDYTAMLAILLASETGGWAADAPVPEFEVERYDSLGHSMWFAEVHTSSTPLRSQRILPPTLFTASHPPRPPHPRFAWK